MIKNGLKTEKDNYINKTVKIIALHIIVNVLRNAVLKYCTIYITIKGS